jgi:hypothetical protein
MKKKLAMEAERARVVQVEGNGVDGHARLNSCGLHFIVFNSRAAVSKFLLIVLSP